MTGTGDSESGRGGRIREGLGQIARLAAVLGAAALLSVVGMAWASYLRGRPVDLLGVWLAGAPTAGPSLPEGAVIAVLAETCPRPWQEYLPAQGRFVLGAGSGAAMNLDSNGTLLPVRRAGDVGGQGGVELQIADLPPHTHRFAVGEVPPGIAGDVALGVPDAASEPAAGMVTPFVHKRGLGWRNFYLVDALEPVGGVITSDRRLAARRHDSIPPFVALTFCFYSSEVAIDLAGATK